MASRSSAALKLVRQLQCEHFLKQREVMRCAQQAVLNIIYVQQCVTVRYNVIVSQRMRRAQHREGKQHWAETKLLQTNGLPCYFENTTWTVGRGWDST